MRSIAIVAEERRDRDGGDDDSNPPLDVCLAGFKRYFDEHFGVVLPLDVADDVPPAVYHDSGMCGLTRRCHVSGCSNVEEPTDITDLENTLAAQTL